MGQAVVHPDPPEDHHGDGEQRKPEKVAYFVQDERQGGGDGKNGQKVEVEIDLAAEPPGKRMYDMAEGDRQQYKKQTEIQQVATGFDPMPPCDSAAAVFQGICLFYFFQSLEP